MCFKSISLEEHAKNALYVFKSGKQNGGQNHNIKDTE
jgi:hypothetical protein